MRLSYAIKFVSDMDAAVAFHRDVLGLAVRFVTPEWTEIETGQTTLALHIASAEHAPGSVELGFAGDDLAGFYARREELGVTFLEPPAARHGTSIAKIADPDGAAISVSG